MIPCQLMLWSQSYAIYKCADQHAEHRLTQCTHVNYVSIEINLNKADQKVSNISLDHGLLKFNRTVSYCRKNKFLRTYISTSLLNFTIYCPPITLAEQISISEFHDEMLGCYANFGMTNSQGMAMLNKVNFQKMKKAHIYFPYKQK